MAVQLWLWGEGCAVTPLPRLVRLRRGRPDVATPRHGSPRLQSFPSGHTSWSTSGLGFTTFWLLGKVRAACACCCAALASAS